MPRIDSEKFFTSAINMYGTSAKGVNWHSKQSQEIRYDILLEILPKNLSSISIADAGCGFGDFYLYIEKRANLPKNYIGIDSLVDMYSIASEQTGCEIIIADICKDPLPHADYYICSGAMNILNEFETHLFIRNCFLACSEGFIFNILHGDKQSQTYNYLCTSQIQKIAKDLNVARVEFKDGYLEDDITVGFFK
ncbi:class I SAM-dependent methyltransferase [bacterium]|nr:class I SAM-dependent methyltransferase [bacterium]MBU1993826.1 class I SAM-dependent methyltransferase [bacterium]